MARSLLSLGLCIVCCLALLALAGGCAGSAGALAPALNDSSAASANVAPRPLAMPALPSPASITRDASLIESSLVLNGASFRDDLTHQNVTVDGDLCIYDPSFLSGENPLYSEVALAIYSFDVSPVDSSLLDVCDLDLDGIPDLVIGTARVFAGVPSLSMDKWEWSELSKSSSPSPDGISSWSWGESNPGSLHARSPQGVLNVCIVVFGDTALDVSRVALSPPSSSPSSPPVMQELFRKGWDGTIKCPCAISVDCDDTDRVHASCFDSSNGQLYYFQADGRVVREMCADCDSSSGMSNDLCVAPDGSLLLAYTDDNLHQGVFKTMAPDVMSSLVWSPRSNFDTGDDGTGVVSPVGSRCRTTCFTFDTSMFMCVAYENTGDGTVRLATRSSNSPDFSVETVSPPGQLSSSPVPVSCPDGVCVLYLSRSGGGGAGGLVSLMLAQRDAVGAWFSSVLAEDVQLPDYLDLDDDCDGFCDGSVRPGTNELVAAYSSPSGISFVHFDLSSHTVRIRESPTLPSRGGGAFLRLSMMGDGSVRLVDYAPSSRTIYLSSYFETGDIPTEEQFVSLPAVQLDETRDEDCDGVDLWVDPDDDGDGFHQTVLVSLTSSMTALGQSKKEFKGHVTLLK